MDISRILCIVVPWYLHQQRCILEPDSVLCTMGKFVLTTHVVRREGENKDDSHCRTGVNQLKLRWE
uniref:Uncharacterized protein n=1 Tax=Setaria italica TaxID=4555 RepID=K3YEN0_SETIT